jgi:hypothetical protein
MVFCAKMEMIGVGISDDMYEITKYYGRLNVIA